jgi:hypothetical protein
MEDMEWEEFREFHQLNQHQMVLLMVASDLSFLTRKAYMWQNPEKVRSRTDLFATCLMRAFDNALTGGYKNRPDIVRLWENAHGVISEFAGHADEDLIAPFMEPIDLE